MKILVNVKGGPGSGNRGHGGRPGKRGGSAPKSHGFGSATMSEDFDLDDDYVGKLDRKASDFLSGDLSGHGGWEAATSNQRFNLKLDIANDISKRAALPGANVDFYNRRWAKTSNDTDAQALSIQEAISEEFGVPLSVWQKSKIDEVKASGKWDPQLSRDVERKIARATYDSTQEGLREAGYKSGDTVRLYRGIVDVPGGLSPSSRGTMTYKGNAVDSWSLGYDMASDFAAEGNISGHILAIDITISSIFSTARTGIGCLSEGEFVLFGSIGHEVGVAADY